MKDKNVELSFVLYSREYEDIIMGFDCGNEYINDFLKQLDHKKYPEEYVIHLVIDKVEDRLVGYYALSSTSLVSNIDGKYRGKPAIEIKMFAISKDYQKLFLFQEEEEILLADDVLTTVLGDIYKMSLDQIGIEYIVLHSVPNSIGFYKRNGFILSPKELYAIEFYDRCLTDCELMVFIL